MSAQCQGTKTAIQKYSYINHKIMSTVGTCLCFFNTYHLLHAYSSIRLSICSCHSS
uniref:Uncharacterized protein n=1 Tax=Arundo donax TaxID=35708 RepID=A0A0A8YVI8_ARUDO